MHVCFPRSFRAKAASALYYMFDAYYLTKYMCCLTLAALFDYMLRLFSATANVHSAMIENVKVGPTCKLLGLPVLPVLYFVSHASQDQCVVAAVKYVIAFKKRQGS